MSAAKCSRFYCSVCKSNTCCQGCERRLYCRNPCQNSPAVCGLAIVEPERAKRALHMQELETEAKQRKQRKRLTRSQSEHLDPQNMLHIGDRVQRRFSIHGSPEKVMTGSVTYIHPKGRYHLVETESGLRECFPGAQAK